MCFCSFSLPYSALDQDGMNLDQQLPLVPWLVPGCGNRCPTLMAITDRPSPIRTFNQSPLCFFNTIVN